MGEKLLICIEVLENLKNLYRICVFTCRNLKTFICKAMCSIWQKCPKPKCRPTLYKTIQKCTRWGKIKSFIFYLWPCTRDVEAISNNHRPAVSMAAEKEKVKNECSLKYWCFAATHWRNLQGARFDSTLCLVFLGLCILHRGFMSAGCVSLSRGRLQVAVFLSFVIVPFSVLLNQNKQSWIS